MKEKISQSLITAMENLGIIPGVFVVEHPEDTTNGDYSTNIALATAKQASINPRELAEKIKEELGKNTVQEISKIEIAGPGFINFYLSQEFFIEQVKQIVVQGDTWGQNKLFMGKKVMVEYTQPNPFKPFHIGHLMSNAIGESLSRLIEYSGAKVIRANYQGDVGPHVAKAFYGIQKRGMPDMSGSASVLASYIGECYAQGSEAYDTDPKAKKEIESLNKRIYDKSDIEVNQVYEWGRNVTLEAFEEIYKMLGTKFDYYFFESEMAPIGEKIVRENIGTVFTESDGAIVFKAQEYDSKLHTRVFINSQGLPTYETKEVGLTVTKFEKENPDLSIVETAVEQADYMRVVEKAISLLHPEYSNRMKHITHGMMRLASGKMSSRKGNVVTGESLIIDAHDMVYEKVADRDFDQKTKDTIASDVGVAAIKYSILRSAIGGDIIFDFEKSISFEGDSGPYLQYTVVRARSVLAKTKGKVFTDTLLEKWQVTNLEKHLYRFPEVVQYAVSTYEPHHVATYLTELASHFNSFYATHHILDEADPNMEYKVSLTKSFELTMRNGLWLLGIQVPEKM